jgi:hypothetical protein
MPLIHSKRPAAFKKNIETEMRAGKPQKQAVAIAYSEKREAEHKYDGGPCMACGGGVHKYAEGGDVFSPAKMDSHKAEKGVHHTHTRFDKLDKGQSRAGSFVQHGLDKDAKAVHEHKLGELREMKGADRRNLAEGGEVDADGDYDGDEAGDADNEISHGLGKELIGAFESKDHKKVMSALEAAVLHCMNKEDPEDV